MNSYPKIVIILGILIGFCSGIFIKEWWRAMALTVLILSSIFFSKYIDPIIYQ